MWRVAGVVKAEREAEWKEEHQQIYELIDEKLRRTLDLAQEKGSGAWLTALPIQSLGYTLNKQEFRDSVCLRYGWNIPNTPSFCQCGKENDLDHPLICKKGRYVTMRHDRIRDLEANLIPPNLISTSDPRCAFNRRSDPRGDTAMSIAICSELCDVRYDRPHSG